MLIVFAVLCWFDPLPSNLPAPKTWAQYSEVVLPNALNYSMSPSHCDVMWCLYAHSPQITLASTVYCKMSNRCLLLCWSGCCLDLPFCMLTSAVHPTSPKHWGCTCLISFSFHLILPVFLTSEIPHSTSLYSLVCFQILSDLISSANLISMLFTTPPPRLQIEMLRIKKNVKPNQH